MPQQPRPDRERQISVRSSLRLGLTLFFLGFVLITGPLVLTLFVAENSVHPIYVNYSVFLVLGVFLLALGASIVVSLAVRVQAVGAGQLKLLGLEFPVEIQGAMFVFLMLLLLMGFATNYFRLDLLSEEWTKIVKLREANTSMEVEIPKLKQDAAVSKAEADAYREVIMEQVSGKAAHALMIRFKCDEFDEPRSILWKEVAGGNYGGLLPSRKETATDGSREEIINPVELTDNRSRVFIITHPSPTDPTKSQKVVSASFEFMDGVLVATIWPNEISLSEVCSQQGSIVRGAENRSLEDQQGQDTLNAAAEAKVDQ